MAGYFVDTSALAKLYHEEFGSDYVEGMLNRPGSRGMISRLSLVEIESVLAIKVRTGASMKMAGLWPCGASAQTSPGIG